LTRKLWALAVTVFVLTLLLNLPATLIVRWLDWPPGWQPEGVSGTVWSGNAASVGPVGPLIWKLRPWAGQAQFSGGLQQQAWDLSVTGWPWAWQADLLPGEPLVTPAASYTLDGHWTGRLQLRGRGSRCTTSEGELRGQDMALLSPWMMVLGNATLRVDCTDGLQVLAEVQREGEHRFAARLQPFTRRANITGQVEPEASVTPLLIQANLLKAGESRFEKTLGGR
jgi:general secretion pathway protein N